MLLQDAPTRLADRVAKEVIGRCKRCPDREDAPPDREAACLDYSVDRLRDIVQKLESANGLKVARVR
jgi:hypothetical protein